MMILQVEESRCNHPQLVPHTGIPFQAVNALHRGTETKPFSFDEQIKEMRAKKAAKIRKCIEDDRKVGKFNY